MQKEIKGQICEGLTQLSDLPLVTVIVVNYNGQDHLSDCLTAVCADRQSPVVDIIVVDNASTDNSQAIAHNYAARFPALKVLPSSINRGYAGGVNLALREAQGKYIAVLNMDAIVTTGWLRPMVDFMEANPAAGAVSPLILLDGEDGRINAIGQNIHVTGLGFNRGLGKFQNELGIEPIPVSGIHGGAFVIRRDIFDRIGGLDENGFLYHEDVDISWLLHIMGYGLYCIPQSTVRHKYFLTMYPEKLYLLERNRVAMLLAHLEITSLILLVPFLFFTEAMMWGYCILRGRGFVRAKFKSYRWVVQQRRRLQARKQFIRSLRICTDWQVLRRLSWEYEWDQLFTLGRERGLSRRQPAGGIPLQKGESL